MIDEFQKLREGLQAMPVPEPRAGFVDRALAKATGTQLKVAELRRPRPVLTRPLTWWAAAAGALAASIAWLAVIALRQSPLDESHVQLALNESREISLVIDSERALEDATIHVYVSGGVELAGYGEQREIEWATSLNPGSNLLSLPVVARAPGDGRVVAVIEHAGKSRRVSVAMRVTTVRG